MCVFFFLFFSYKPGSWIRKGGGLQQSDYKVPERTTILLIGPRGSGKSSLINRISKVFDTDKFFASDRAQITCNLFNYIYLYLHTYIIIYI